MLRGIEGVTGAAARAVADPTGVTSLVAYYETRPEADVDPRGLRDRIDSLLPPHMVPSVLQRVEHLPRTAGGKLDRRTIEGWPAPTPAIGGPDMRVTPTEEVVSEVWAGVLGVAKVNTTDSFFELGGHSIAATRAIIRLREAFGVALPLRLLFEQPTVRRLAAAIDGHRGRASASLPLPRIVPDPASRFHPFPLTDIQQAYWVGREQGLVLGGMPAHAYLEFEALDLDFARFQRAVDQVINRHDMLRAVLLPNGEQQVKRCVPSYVIAVTDLANAEVETQGRHVDAVRTEMAAQQFDVGCWPLFELRATALGSRRYRLHLSIDLLITDADSLAILGRDLERYYLDPDQLAEPLELSFRDYVVAENALRRSPLYEAARSYWMERLPVLPPAPDLPLATRLEALDEPTFGRLSGRLEAAEWSALKHQAARAGLTPSSLLLSVYAVTLGAWSRSRAFTLNVTTYNGLPFHPDVDELVGDFTCLTLLSVELRDGPFLEQVRAIQTQFLNDLDHSAFNGLEVMRARARLAGGPTPVPVVFTSTLPLHTRRPRRTVPVLGTFVYGITQSPQTLLDHQVSEEDVRTDLPMGSHGQGFSEGPGRDNVRFLPRPARAPCSGSVDLGRARRPARRDDSGAGAESVRAAGYTPRTRARSGEADAQCRGRCGPRPNAHLRGVDGRVAIVRSFAHPGRPGTRGTRRCHARKGVAAARRDPRRAHRGRGVSSDRSVPPPARVAELLDLGRVRLGISDLPIAIGAGLSQGVRWLPLEETPDAQPGEVEDDGDHRQLAYVMFTSGSTGRPKGVMIEHVGAVNTIIDVNDKFGVSCTDRTLALSSVGFDLSVYDLFGPLFVGGSVVYTSGEKDPEQWRTIVRQHRVTIWNSVPALMDMLLSCDGPAADSLRLVLLSGDWIPLSLPERILCQAPGGTSGQPRRGHRGEHLVDLPPDRATGSDLAQYTVRSTALRTGRNGPDGRVASLPGLGDRLHLHSRRGSGPRLLARPGCDVGQLPARPGNQRPDVPYRRLRSLPRRRFNRDPRP